MKTNQTQPAKRLLALDVFRGITIALMLIVNNPGNEAYIYPQLQHAAWHGLTLADLVFPFFLSSVGISIAFSLAARSERGLSQSQLFCHILLRTAILFGLGILANFCMTFDLATIRIPGVLQRIAICYFITYLLIMKIGSKGRFLTGLTLFISYGLILKLIPVPGYGMGNLSYAVNICGYLDNRLLHGHLLEPAFDPEGILSTIPAIITTLIGFFAGEFIRKKITREKEIVNGLNLTGVFMLTVGMFGSLFLPLNKKLWTDSYVLVTAGIAFLILAALIWLIECKQWRKWAVPFTIFGTNAIFVYVASEISSALLNQFKLSAVVPVSLPQLAVRQFIQPAVGDPRTASLLYALGFTIIWLFIVYRCLYRRKIFIKV